MRRRGSVASKICDIIERTRKLSEKASKMNNDSISICNILDSELENRVVLGLLFRNTESLHDEWGNILSDVPYTVPMSSELRSLVKKAANDWLTENDLHWRVLFVGMNMSGEYLWDITINTKVTSGE